MALVCGGVALRASTTPPGVRLTSLGNTSLPLLNTTVTGIIKYARRILKGQKAAELPCSSLQKWSCS